MKADRIVSDNIFTTSASIFFLSDVEQSGYYTDAVMNADFSDVGSAAD
jgi:hypothetical protein